MSGIYSPLDTEGKHEAAAKAIIERELGSSVNVVCSRDGKCSNRLLETKH